MNFYAAKLVYLDLYLEHLGFKKLAKKYTGKGLTLKLTLSDSRYKRIIASSTFEKRLDETINSDNFDNDFYDLAINKNGKIYLIAE